MFASSSESEGPWTPVKVAWRRRALLTCCSNNYGADGETFRGKEQMVPLTIFGETDLLARGSRLRGKDIMEGPASRGIGRAKIKEEDSKERTASVHIVKDIVNRQKSELSREEMGLKKISFLGSCFWLSSSQGRIVLPI